MTKIVTEIEKGKYGYLDLIHLQKFFDYAYRKFSMKKDAFNAMFTTELQQELSSIYEDLADDRKELIADYSQNEETAKRALDTATKMLEKLENNTVLSNMKEKIERVVHTPSNFRDRTKGPPETAL